MTDRTPCATTDLGRDSNLISLLAPVLLKTMQYQTAQFMTSVLELI